MEGRKEGEKVPSRKRNLAGTQPPTAERSKSTMEGRGETKEQIRAPGWQGQNVNCLGQREEEELEERYARIIRHQLRVLEYGLVLLTLEFQRIQVSFPFPTSSPQIVS